MTYQSTNDQSIGLRHHIHRKWRHLVRHQMLYRIIIRLIVPMQETMPGEIVIWFGIQSILNKKSTLRLDSNIGIQILLPNTPFGRSVELLVAGETGSRRTWIRMRHHQPIGSTYVWSVQVTQLNRAQLKNVEKCVDLAPLRRQDWILLKFRIVEQILCSIHW